MFAMHEFIPKRIYQTHTGSWSLVKSQTLHHEALRVET